MKFKSVVFLTFVTVISVSAQEQMMQMEKKGPPEMVGKPTFEQTVDGYVVKTWLITQDEHKKMMEKRSGEMKHEGMMEGMKSHQMMEHHEMGEAKHDKENMEHSKMSKETMEAMMSGTHHVMVMATDEKTKKEVEKANIEIQVETPAKKSSTVKLTGMMNHFGGGLILDEKGEYTLSILMKIENKTVTTKFKYQVK